MTVIPPYEIYEETWRMSGWLNPFDADWTKFNRYDSMDIAYVEEIIGSMDEQIEMWGVDRNSSCHDVFIYFNAYIGSLKTFYCYILGVEYWSLWPYTGGSDKEIAEYALTLPVDWCSGTNDLFISLAFN